MKRVIYFALACVAAFAVISAASAETINLAYYLQQNIYTKQMTVTEPATPSLALALLLQGPTAEDAAQGVVSSIPAGTRLISLETTANGAVVNLSSEAASGLSSSKSELMFSQLVFTLMQFGLDVNVRLMIEGKPLSDYLPVLPSPVYSAPVISATQQQKLPTGASVGLSGKRITVSPGHGWAWQYYLGYYWQTQRGTACTYPCEDFNDLDIATWLVKYLEGDGAYVQRLREHDKTRGNGPSGHPWWQESAYVYCKDAGYDCAVYADCSGVCSYTGSADHGCDDVDVRGLASNMDARGNTDLFLSIHTNSGGGTAKGTTVWYCDTGSHVPWGATSIDLCDKIGDATVAAINAAGEKCADGTTWGFLGNVGTRYGDFGEARIPARPAALMELGFHDNCTADAPKLHDPFFQSVAMWGEYKGVCDYMGVTPRWDMMSDEIVSHDIPISMSTGETRTVHITLKNHGILWQSAKGFKLSAVNGSDPFTSTLDYAVTADTGPGDAITFTLTLTAPSTAAYYVTDWRMQRTGYGFFGPTISRNINVGLPPDSQAPSVPASLAGSAQSTTQINLTWAASTDNVAVAGYRVYRGGVQIGTTQATNYSDTTCGPDVTYSYRVSAYDDAGNESAQCTAINVTTPYPSELIVDEESAQFAGTWTSATGVSPSCYGGDYKYAIATTSETATAIFRPNIIRAGNYEVYVYYRAGDNRTYYAPYTIYYNGGSQLYRVNQEINGGKWNLLGTKAFASGTAGYVKVGNNTSDTGEVVVADAVRFVMVVADPPAVPTDGTPVAASASSIAWNWSDVSTETGYRVKDTGGVIKSGDLAANTITWAEPGLTANTQYTRRVYAFNANGESAGSTGQARYTLANAPTYATSGDVTIQCSLGQTKGDCTAAENIAFTFNNAFGSGAANVGQFDFSWDQTATWDGTGGTLWTSGATLTKQVGSAGQSYYLHIRAYNVDSPKAANPTVLNLGPYTVPGAERLLNPGFESWTGGTSADNWTVYNSTGGVSCQKGSTFAGTPAITDHGGSECQRVKCEVTTSEEGGVYQRFSSTAGSSYTVNLWILTRKTSSTDAEGKLGVDPSGATVPGTNTTWSTTVTGDSAWTQKTLNVTATGTYVTVFCNARHNASGTTQCNVFFDDASASPAGDITPPITVTVTDAGSYTPSQSSLSASWTASSDSESGLNRYEYAVGTSSSTQNTKAWTSNGTSTSVAIAGLSMADGSTYYVQARAVDNAGNVSAGSAANGILAAIGVTPISSARTKADDTQPLSLRNKIVTAKIGSAFWLEETDRTSAIKVSSSASVAKGNTVSVAGVMHNDGVQRYLIGDVVVNSGGSTVIQPLGVTCKWLGGGSYNPSTPGVGGGQGQYNIGLLVRCWGKVTYYNTSDANNKYCYINDGSGLSSGGHDGIKVWCGTVNPPTTGAVIVTGVISTESIGGKIVPILMIRDTGDLRTP